MMQSRGKCNKFKFDLLRSSITIIIFEGVVFLFFHRVACNVLSFCERKRQRRFFGHRKFALFSKKKKDVLLEITTSNIIRLKNNSIYNTFLIRRSIAEFLEFPRFVVYFSSCSLRKTRKFGFLKSKYLVGKLPFASTTEKCNENEKNANKHQMQLYTHEKYR